MHADNFEGPHSPPGEMVDVDMQVAERSDLRHTRKRGIEGQEGAAGLADVMSKVLASTKPKKKANKVIILSRAKKEVEIPATQQSERAPRPKDSKEKQADLRLENLNRVKPDPAQDFHLERQLTKIATRGVVRLFNAVTVQQKITNIKKEGKSKSVKKKPVTKQEDLQQFDSIISKMSEDS